MTDTDPSPEEALTKEEIQSASEPPPAKEKRKNACTATDALPTQNRIHGTAS